MASSIAAPAKWAPCWGNEGSGVEGCSRFESEKPRCPDSGSHISLWLRAGSSTCRPCGQTPPSGLPRPWPCSSSSRGTSAQLCVAAPSRSDAVLQAVFQRRPGQLSLRAAEISPREGTRSGSRTVGCISLYCIQNLVNAAFSCCNLGPRACLLERSKVQDGPSPEAAGEHQDRRR